MVIIMEQNYCMVNKQTNVCDNVCVWDGNTSTWAPPSEYLMLVQATTPAKIWNLINNNWELVEQIGQGQINFVWDGTYLITNQEPPTGPTAEPAINQPTTVGTQTL